MGGQTKENNLLHYILKFAGDEKKHYVRSIIFALIGVVFSMLPFLLMGDMVKKLFEGERDFNAYLLEGILMAICWILRIVFHTLSTNTSHRTTFRLIGNVREMLCDKLARLPLGTVLDMPSGALKNIMVERVDSIEPTLAHVVPEFTSNIAAPVFMFIYLLTIDWRMALISLATLPVALGCMMMMFKDYEVNFKRTQDTTKVLNETAVEYINGIEVIKAFGKTESSYQKFADAAKDNANSFIDWMRGCIVPFSLAMVVAPATMLAVLPLGALFTLHASLSLADFALVIILSMGLVTPFITIMGYNDDIGKATSIFGEIDFCLELPELVRPKSSKEGPGRYDIVLSDVRFGYGEKEVLHGINLVIPEGKVTALVGPSGSGKSTIAKLIASLWDVGSGSITIGGTDIRDMTLTDYNAQVAYVSQDTFLFDRTVRENIRMGNPSATDAEVEQAARDSGCYDFIMELENGFDTMVGGSGAHLSGGERQRISIARAMMKNAPILILDEATAYTDPENEAVIQKAVSSLAAGRTMSGERRLCDDRSGSGDKTLIVIAHRLSTITCSDQIVVVRESALYKKMWEAHIYATDTEEGGVA